MSIREDTDPRLEKAIDRIAGVVKAKVRSEDGTPVQVYAIASGERPAEQIAQDIQSLAIAAFDLDLDPSVVSVVQLKADPHAPPPAPETPFEPVPKAPDPVGEETLIDLRARPAIDKVFVARDGGSGWIRVTLRWPDGSLTQGAAQASERRPSRARGAAEATLRALADVATEKGLTLEIDEVAERTVAGRSSVLVHVFSEGGGKKLSLMGSAFVGDDIGSATVKAFLNAVDRII